MIRGTDGKYIFVCVYINIYVWGGIIKTRRYVKKVQQSLSRPGGAQVVSRS